MLFVASIILGTSSVQAFDLPSFSSCPTPGGDPQAQYSSGTHGIPGDVTTYTGSDSVFKLNSSQLVQCFCPEPSTGNSGIQTNWWKISDLTQNEINSLKNLGWVFIPDGTVWGLDPGAFLAANSSFSCGSVNATQSSYSAPGPGQAPVCDSAVPPAPRLISVERMGTTAKLTWSKVVEASTYFIFYGTQPGKNEYSVPDTGNVTTFTIGSLVPGQKYYFDVRSVNNCMPSAASAVGGGEVLGASFAPTGNTLTLISVTGLGLLLLGLSIAVRYFHKREV